MVRSESEWVPRAVNLGLARHRSFINPSSESPVLSSLIQVLLLHITFTRLCTHVNPTSSSLRREADIPFITDYPRLTPYSTLCQSNQRIVEKTTGRSKVNGEVTTNRGYKVSPVKEARRGRTLSQDDRSNLAQHGALTCRPLRREGA